MTEYEILDLVSSNSSDLATMFSVYLSLLSAYIAVVYLVGDKLSVLQAVSLSLLFLYGAGGQALGQYNINLQNSDLFNRLSELRPLTRFEEQYVTNGNIWAAVMGVGVIVAITFLWSVRHTKTE